MPHDVPCALVLWDEEQGLRQVGRRLEGWGGDLGIFSAEHRCGCRTHSELVVVAMALRHPREVYVPTGEQSARRHRRRDLPSEISTHPNDHVKLHATLRLVPEWSNLQLGRRLASST